MIWGETELHMPQISVTEPYRVTQQKPSSKFMRIKVKTMPLYTNWEQNSVFAFFRRFVNTINFTGIVFNSGFNHYINSHCRKFYRIFATQKDVSSISLRPHCLLSASLVPIASLSCLYSAAILSPSFSSLRQLIVSPKTGLYRP